MASFKGMSTATLSAINGYNCEGWKDVSWMRIEDQNSLAARLSSRVVDTANAGTAALPSQFWSETGDSRALIGWWLEAGSGRAG